MKKHIRELQAARRKARNMQTGFGEVEILEAKGKTIKRMVMELDSDYQCVSVEFTDDTQISVDVKPAVQFQVQRMRDDDGDLVVLKNYKPILAISGKDVEEKS